MTSGQLILGQERLKSPVSTFALPLTRLAEDRALLRNVIMLKETRRFNTSASPLC